MGKPASSSLDLGVAICECVYAWAGIYGMCACAFEFTEHNLQLLQLSIAVHELKNMKIKNHQCPYNAFPFSMSDYLFHSCGDYRQIKSTTD